jgi:hypothetical protein
LLAFQAIEQSMTDVIQSQGGDYGGGIVLGSGGPSGLHTFLWTVSIDCRLPERVLFTLRRPYF